MIELLGAEKADRDLIGISERLARPELTLRREMRVLETAEAGTFAQLGGRYVATGATMRSLVSPEAPHAIRRTLPNSLEFGTSVPYARYLTETIGPHGERPLPVAVLKLTPVTRQQIAHDVINHVARGASAGVSSGAFIGGML
jgi:hypothetical protein